MHPMNGLARLGWEYYLRKLEPEDAHAEGHAWMKRGFGVRYKSPAERAVKLFGKTAPNNVGTSGGFDKNAEVIHETFRMGFGFLELGSVTPEMRDGNTIRPRHWRFGPDNLGCINFYGLNSKGIVNVADNIRFFRNSNSQYANGIIGLSFTNPAGVEDPSTDAIFGAMMARTCGLIDFATNNFSCPNSGESGGRSYDRLMRQNEFIKRNGGNIILLDKLSFTLDDEVLEETSRAGTGSGADGFITANTFTYAMAEQYHLFGDDTPYWLKFWPRDPKTGKPVGGYSGPETLKHVRLMVGKLRHLNPGKIILGSGGVDSRTATLQMQNSGADGVQVFNAMASQGPGILPGLFGR